MSLLADTVVHASLVLLVVRLSLVSDALRKILVQAETGGTSARRRFGQSVVGSKGIVSAAFALSAALLVFAAHAAQTTAPEGVLIIHANERPVPATVIIEDTLRRVVRNPSGRPVEFYSEFLDVERFPTETDAAEAEYVARKYGRRNVRVIVASGPQALQFVAKFHDRMLAGIPVVHLGMPRDQLERMALPADIVGKTVDLDPTATLELALRLQPDSKRLVIVLGAAERDRIWEQRVRSAVERLQDRFEVEYIIGLPTADVLHRVGLLSKDTIIYTPGYFIDGAGNVGTPRQALELIAPASAAPVYGPNDTFLGTGAVGGCVASFEEQAKQAGAIVVRLLNGAAPADIATSSVPNLPVVDWRQIRRWRMDERLLPADTVVKFREPTVLEKYWREISVGITILVLQAVLIAALLIQRRRSRLAEQAVQKHRSEIAHASRLAVAGELTASIAHEINQPLGAILSNVETADLLLRSGDDRHELLLQILADIRRDDLRASEVIRRLRALLAKHEIEQNPFELNAAVTEVAALLQGEAERRRVTIEVRLAPVTTLVGDRVQVQQVLINLLLNAMDAVSGLGVDRRTIIVTFKNTEHRITITVRDRGHGVAPEELPKLFDSFYSTKRAGMGLGLSIARTIVGAHGGRIWAESRPGEGTEFHAEFPAVEPTAEEPPAKAVL